MAEEGFRRKLTAILSADVEGYSRLMGEDEDATIRTLTAYRELMSTLIQKQHGRVVDSPGDNLLAEFLSVVDAVRCAVEIQEELRVRNAELPDDRRMEFRIGINLGDVVEEGERIYGDGVNITARVEGLAEGGGICISGTVYDSIKNKLSLGYESLGEHTVKNIKEPVRIYRMRVGPDAAASGVSKEKKAAVKRWQWAALAAMVVLILGVVAVWNFYFRLPSVEPASVEKMSFPLPDKPSIVVLPFANISGDPNQEYFSDGLYKSIIYQLYKMPADMFVIDYVSASTYKGKSVKVQQVAKELGVRYVLIGGVEKSSDRIRVTTQLIDGVTGEQLWGERYDRELEEVFEVQDDISRKVVNEMEVKIAEGEAWRLETHATDNYQAFEYYTQADKILRGGANRQNYDKMRELLKKAIELDPQYARAIAWLGHTNLTMIRRGWSNDPKQSVIEAKELADRALSIDPNNYMAHALLSRIYLGQKLYEKAIGAVKQAVEAEPNNSTAYYFLASTMNQAGRPDEALLAIRKAMRLSPYPPFYYITTAGLANYLTGNYKEAIIEFQKVINRWKSKKRDHTARDEFKWIIASHIELGQDKDAKTQAQELLKQHPEFSVDSYIQKLKKWPYKDTAFLDRKAELLHKAGLD
jgi:TolB-like protein/class 3 adenylate cyclase/Tfp pilus assembly protein PilF